MIVTPVAKHPITRRSSEESNAIARRVGGPRRGVNGWRRAGGRCNGTEMSAVVDADGHVLEPPDCWARYVDPAWRERAIRVRRGADGRDVLEIDGRPAR